MNGQGLTCVFSTRQDNPEFTAHVRKTCGIEDVEILQFINDNAYSLTEVYNRGLKEARYDIVVFCHDDVIFEETDSWGRKILAHFNNSEFGILGKAGTTSLLASGKWWDQFHLMVGQVWHRQRDPATGQIHQWENKYSSNFGERIIETVLVDGLFFAVHRDRIKKTFDENIKRFHFYDIDFSFANHLEGVKVGVIFDMNITHKSVGITNNQWEINRLGFIDKWGKYLPYSIKPEIIFNELDIVLDEQPNVAVIILVRDKVESLARCVNSIWRKSRYRNYKIYVAGSVTISEIYNEKNNLFEHGDNIVFFESNDLNPSRLRNSIVRNRVDSDTELLLFCHDDIELINDALSRCVQIYLDSKPEIGTIGIRLYSGDNTIQHAGLLLYFDGNNHFGVTSNGFGTYYSYSPNVERDTTGNTGAFMAISMDLFLSLGGFPEHYAGYFDDVELNLKSIIAGRVNYFAGDAVAYHYETGTFDSKNTSIMNADFQRLFLFVRKNLHNQRVLQYIRFF